MATSRARAAKTGTSERLKHFVVETGVVVQEGCPLPCLGEAAFISNTIILSDGGVVLSALASKPKQDA
jgi:hypothetical protein